MVLLIPKKGDKLKLQCGATVVIRDVDLNGIEEFCVGIKLVGFDTDDDWLLYNADGEYGRGAVNEQCPLDIVGIERDE